MSMKLPRQYRRKCVLSIKNVFPSCKQHTQPPVEDIQPELKQMAAQNGQTTERERERKQQQLKGLQGETVTFPKQVRAGGLPMQIIITGDLGSHLEDEKIDKE